VEKQLPQKVRAVLLVSETEANCLRSFANPGPVYAIPNGVDFQFFQKDAAVSINNLTCVFVGALDYFPNIDGVTWFCREVWPIVYKEFPTTVFHIVGRKPTDEILRLQQIPGVEVVGEVPDVRPFLNQGTIVVIPLRIARGIQNKVLEGLAMAKAVVASPESLKALQCQSGKHLLSAETTEQWIKAVSRLLADSTLRKTLGQSGRQFVEENHSWEKCLKPLNEILSRTSLHKEPMETRVPIPA
jgi:sugar transferase (PEP-CTERM/EpsH1 system associated)